MYYHVYVMIVICVYCITGHCLCQSTGAGQFATSDGSWVACNPNFYRDGATNSCKPCSYNVNNDKELASPCNSTHDNVYRCVKGKFNDNGRQVTCQVCSNCSHDNHFEAQACREDANTICCPYRGMTLEIKTQNATCPHESDHLGYCCRETLDVITTSPSSPDDAIEDKATSSSLSPSYTSDNSSASIFGPPVSTSNLSTLAIFGIILGVIIVFFVIIYILYRFYPKRRDRHPVPPEDPDR
ncbi:hypothetical protein Btru_076468 [Bulinus truncatus]|nr:hypothetical protein Btru_076468 [Bulinus truncatus]